MSTAVEERMLVHAPIGRDGPLTVQLLERTRIQSVVCRDMIEVCRRVEEEGAGGLVLAEEALTPAALVRLTALLAQQPPWSDLPIILFTAHHDDPTRRPEVGNLLQTLGNVTLLDRPVRPITMISAVHSALRARRRQYAGRDELQAQQRAVRQRDEFLAMLGHELRNPLGAMRLALEMMERSPDRCDKYRGVVKRQSANLSRMVDDLLDVSRVTSGKITLQPQEVDLVELLRRCVQSQESAIAAQGLGVELQVTGRLPVKGDPVRLEQVFVNLVTNAIKYTPRGGHLWIRGGAEHGRAVIEVRDDGVGISQEMLPRVFDLFVQSPGTLDRAKGGLGIGLTLVRSLVELHGGMIEAASGGVGMGSTFTVRLPLCEAATVRASSADPEAVAADAREILLVEDNVDMRDTLRELLETFGHTVEVAADGPEAVERAVELEPEVCIIDIGLPGIDGYEVARRLRVSLGDRVYLIALTGYGQPEDRRRAFDAGFDSHFTKPVDVRSIGRLLARADLLAG